MSYIIRLISRYVCERPIIFVGSNGEFMETKNALMSSWNQLKKQ